MAENIAAEDDLVVVVRGLAEGLPLNQANLTHAGATGGTVYKT